MQDKFQNIFKNAEKEDVKIVKNEEAISNNDINSYFIDALAWKRELFLYELLGYAGYFVKKEELIELDKSKILCYTINVVNFF